MSFFVYFNTESNKFNFIQGDGQLQISNGQPIVKTNTVVVGKGRALRTFFDRHFESYHWTSIQTNMLVITGPASRQTAVKIST